MKAERFRHPSLPRRTHDRADGRSEPEGNLGVRQALIVGQLEGTHAASSATPRGQRRCVGDAGGVRHPRLAWAAQADRNPGFVDGLALVRAGFADDRARDYARSRRLTSSHHRAWRQCAPHGDLNELSSPSNRRSTALPLPPRCRHLDVPLRAANEKCALEAHHDGRGLGRDPHMYLGRLLADDARQDALDTRNRRLDQETVASVDTPPTA